MKQSELKDLKQRSFRDILFGYSHSIADTYISLMTIIWSFWVIFISDISQYPDIYGHISHIPEYLLGGVPLLLSMYHMYLIKFYKPRKATAFFLACFFFAMFTHFLATMPTATAAPVYFSYAMIWLMSAINS